MTALILNWPRHLKARCPDLAPGEEPDLRCLNGSCVHVNLFCCTRCGGAEGSLPTDCPGARMDLDTEQLIYEGRLNYINGLGWVNPGDRAWRSNA